MTAALHRRHFLATGGTALAVGGVQAAVPALPQPLGSAGTRWRILGIAPVSDKMPQLYQDYRRSVELGLAQAGAASRIELSWLSAGRLPSGTVRTVESTLRDHGVDAVLGWMPPLLSAKVSALTEKAGVPLWISDTGADMHITARPHPLTVRHSLELCAMASALADKAHAQCGPRAFLSMGWHESGFDFLQAFQHRWRSLGGQIVGRHVAGAPGPSQEFGDLRQAIVSQQPDVVVALYSGRQAHRFAKWWQQAMPGPRQPALAGLPWLAAEQAGGVPAWTVASWPVAGEADSHWRSHFAQADLSWTAAALLGAEAGFSLGAALAAAAPGTDAREIWAALHAAPLMGPRGERRWLGAAGDSAGPLWERSSLSTHAWQQRHAYPYLSTSSAAQSGWITGYLLT